jgi:hypothetical protein
VDGYIPDPTHIEPANVLKTQRLMTIAGRTIKGEIERKKDAAEYETDENAMWLLGSVLGGKIISETAPF